MLNLFSKLFAVKGDTKKLNSVKPEDETAWLRNKVRENFSWLKENIQTPYDEQIEQIIRSFFSLIIGYQPRSITFERAYVLTLSVLEEQVHAEHVEKNYDPNHLPSNGLDFEHWVAEGLRKYGWNAHPTQGSSDQGLDVEAEKNGIKIGLQCKLYSSSVGNKAVQEIIAAKTYYDLDAVGVISNAGYTKSAQELANKSDVKLLSQHDIPNFDVIFIH